MGIFVKDRAEPRKPRQQSDETDRAVKRVSRLPTHELIPWAETCLYAIGRNLNEYAKGNDPDALAEASQAAESLTVVMDEINARSGDVPL